MKVLAISQTASVSAIIAICGLSGCANTPTAGESTSITAVAVVVPTPVGCGVIFVGTPVTFRVASGPQQLKGQLVEVVVPCLDFYPTFYAAGVTYELQLTRKNLYRIDIWPDELTAPNKFFLKSATNLGTGDRNTWEDLATRRGY